MKRCPPGVICVENITISLLIIILLVISMFIYMNSSKVVSTKNDRSVNERNVMNFFPSWPYTNIDKDVLMNPYEPPYRDDRYLVPSVMNSISTNIGSVSSVTSYRQMGIITPLNGTSKDNILPLMGKQLLTNRDKWQYYTISNQHNNVKLPISFKGKSGLNDYGVDQIYNGDTIYVEGYNEPFKVTVYENDTIKYLPLV